MKNTFYSFLTVLFVVFTNINYSYSQQINPKITEVYGDKTQELVINEPSRFEFLNDLLDNRIKVLESPLTGNDKFTKLSSVAIVNKFNNSLTRDISYDPNTFNPLKYDLKFSSKNEEIYRIDNTDYIIVIHPQNLK